MRYNWAPPRTVVVSQRGFTLGSTDALTPFERRGIPLLRTWQRGAVHFEWGSDHIVMEGFLDEPDEHYGRAVTQ
jgi:competence protein ComEC